MNPYLPVTECNSVCWAATWPGLPDRPSGPVKAVGGDPAAFREDCADPVRGVEWRPNRIIPVGLPPAPSVAASPDFALGSRLIGGRVVSNNQTNSRAHRQAGGAGQPRKRSERQRPAVRRAAAPRIQGATGEPGAGLRPAAPCCARRGWGHSPSAVIRPWFSIPRFRFGADPPGLSLITTRNGLGA